MSAWTMIWFITGKSGQPPPAPAAPGVPSAFLLQKPHHPRKTSRQPQHQHYSVYHPEIARRFIFADNSPVAITTPPSFCPRSIPSRQPATRYACLDDLSYRGTIRDSFSGVDYRPGDCAKNKALFSPAGGSKGYHPRHLFDSMSIKHYTFFRESCKEG